MFSSLWEYKIKPAHTHDLNIAAKQKTQPIIMSKFFFHVSLLYSNKQKRLTVFLSSRNKVEPVFSNISEAPRTHHMIRLPYRGSFMRLPIVGQDLYTMNAISTRKRTRPISFVATGDGCRERRKSPGVMSFKHRPNQYGSALAMVLHEAIHPSLPTPTHPPSRPRQPPLHVITGEPSDSRVGIDMRASIHGRGKSMLVYVCRSQPPPNARREGWEVNVGGIRWTCSWPLCSSPSHKELCVGRYLIT